MCEKCEVYQADVVALRELVHEALQLANISFSAGIEEMVPSSLLRKQTKMRELRTMIQDKLSQSHPGADLLAEKNAMVEVLEEILEAYGDTQIHDALVIKARAALPGGKGDE